MLLENTKTDMAIKEIGEKAAQTLAGFLGNLTESVTEEKVAELVKKPAEHVVITLANADADQMLAVLYEQNTRDVLAGAMAAAKISGADSYIVILPEKMNAESAETVGKTIEEIVQKTAGELGISGQLKKLAIQYGLDPVVVYPHSFRHRFAKSFLERCNDIAFLADLMGHESIETTRIYLRKTATEQRTIVDKVVTW